MDTNEMKVNEDVVVEVSEKITNAGNGKALKIAGGVGLAALVGIGIYRYVVKPIAARRKAKKDLQMEELEAVDTDVNFDEIEE